MNNMRKLLTSKKFWMAIAGVVAVVLSNTAGIPEEQTLMIAGIIIAYILGQGLADSAGKNE